MPQPPARTLDLSPNRLLDVKNLNPARSRRGVGLHFLVAILLLAVVFSTLFGASNASIGLPTAAAGPASLVPAPIHAAPSPVPRLTASLDVLASSAVVGSTVTVVGWDFMPGATVALRWDGNSLPCSGGDARASSSGVFSCTLLVPLSAGGVHTLTATAASLEQGTAATTILVAPSLVASASGGTVGSPIQLAGTGFPSSAPITIHWVGSGAFCTSTTSPSGAFSCTGTVPVAASGSYRLIASAPSDAVVSSVSFTIHPNLSLSTLSAAVGATLTATGTGFPANAPAHVAWGSNPSICSAMASADGSFTCSFIVPEAGAGAHTVSATLSPTSGTLAVGATITVTSTLSVSAPSSHVGDAIDVAGQGLPASTPFTVLWDWVPVACPAAALETSSDGGFACTLAVPQTVAGAHTISVEAGGITLATTATETVVPSLTLTANQATVGSYDVLSGSGFWENARVSVTWSPGSTPLCRSTTADGGFSCLLVVPAATAGLHTLAVHDLSANGEKVAPVMGALEVLPSLSLSPDSGAPGSTLTVSGSGFAATYPITITWDGVALPCATSTVASDGVGSFSCATAVPSGAIGAHAVVASDGSPAANQALATYWVLPGSPGSGGDRPAATCNSGCSISLSSSSGSVGTTVTVSGSSFAATAKVSVTWSPNAQALCTSTTSSAGAFSCSFTVPPAVQGSHTVTAADNSTPSNFNTATFSVTSQVTLSASSGIVGTSVTASGSGFAASSATTVTWSPGSVVVCPSTSTTTNSTGSFRCTFQVPSDVQGSHTVTGTDASTNSAAATFSVVPSISLSAASGAVGSSLTVSGTGFAGSSSITDTFDTATVTCMQGSITTSSAGAFTCTFTVPPAVIGAHTVAAKDASSNSASASFTVISTISLSPSSGPVGTTVTVTGHGFAASSTMTGTWAPSGSGTFCTSTSSNATGDFTCSFTVPAAVAGNHLVTLTDSHTNTASENFTVTSQVTLNFATGYVGNTPTITGSGFAGGSLVTVTWSPSGSGTMCSQTSSGLGAFSCTFTVPNADQGAHAVTATDASSNSASTTFTVQPSVSISPTSGDVGSSATVSGQGYTSGASISVSWSGSATFTCTVSGSVSTTGTWSCSVTIPHSPHATYTITATESSGTPNSATTTFTVLSSLTASPSPSYYNTVVTVSASGFGASVGISISIPWTSGTSTCNGLTTSAGDISCSFLVPATVAGPYTITALDASSNSATATVTIDPLLTVSPTSGNVGSAVTVTGEGYAASSSITMLWDASTTLTCSSGSITTSTVGSFSCTSITVPTSVAGAHTVSAHDAATPTANSASTTFTVLPMITISPTSGVVGSSVLVTGTGFAGSTQVTVTWAPGGGTLCKATSGSTGSFSCTFTVPYADQGAHSVKASDGTNAANTLFTVFPQLFLSPTSGPPLINVGVTGTGFGSGAGYTVSVSGAGSWGTCTGTISALGNLTGCTISVAVAPAGAYTFTGTDNSANRSSASATFTITPALYILSTIYGPVGTDVYVEGLGFAASSTTSLTWDVSQALTCIGFTSCSTPPQATFTTMALGWFEAEFVAPPATVGGHTITATDAASNSASTTFTVTTSLTMTLPTSGSGIVGSSVTVVGNGYAASSALTVDFASVSAVQVCSFSTNLTGSFVCVFTVPPAVAGAHTITATDHALNTASVTFTVDANLALSPSSGIVGSTFVATGTGYAGTSTIAATFDGSAIACAGAPIKSSTSGGFNCTLTVPASVAGAHIVRASDGTNAASATFTTQPAITLSPTSGIVSSSTTATGTGFAATSTITMTWDVSTSLTCTVGTVTTSSSGGFSCTFSVPPAVHGAHTVTASDGTNSASATFSVNASLSLNPTSGSVGTSVVATGAGYAAGVGFSVTWSPGAGLLCSGSTTTLGAFSCTFSVPPAVMGSHTVTGTDASSNAATTTFTVNPSVSLSPTSGIVGSTTTVTGAGYPASTSYAVTYDGASVSCTPSGSTSATGDFACTITVPASPAGANTVDGTAGAGSASATFTVLPSLTLNPTSGDVGSSVTATGTGFAAGSSVSFSWDASTVLTCTGGPVTTSSAGGFACTFDVPAAVKGGHSVAAKDAASNSASATYTVDQSITLSPNFGFVGSSVTVQGSGFAGTSAYTVTWSPGSVVLCPASAGPTTNALGSFSCTFTVPPAVEGAHTVSASDAVPNTATATFTVHSSLALTPGSGIVGSSVTATGNGFGGALPITVTWSPSGSLCPSTGSNSTGYFQCSFIVPAAVHGFHMVSASDSAPNTATASYFVDAALTLAPASGLVGSTSTATGTGFAASSSVTLVWSGPTTSLSCTSGSLTTAGTGGFTCAFTVPTAPIGPHTVTATDAASNSATATYTVGPFVSVTPSSGDAHGYGIVGTTVVAAGSGFTAGDLISVTWTPGTLCTGTASSLGSFSCSAVVPATPGAQYTVTATDAHSNSATTLFTVVPAVIGSPNGLPVGGNIWINGTGFYASQSVNVVWTPAGSSGYSICPSTTTHANGSFSCGPFTIPKQAAGPVQVIVYDTGLQANFTYEVTTNLTVSIAVTSPASQPPTDVGVTLTFSASAMLGFTPYASYSWVFGDGSTTTTTASTVTHAYSAASGAGGYTATVTVTDNVGSTASASMPVVVYADPSATSPTASRPSADVGQSVTFSTTETGGVPGGITYTWNGLPSGCTGTSTATVTCTNLPTAGTLSLSVSVTDVPYSGIGGLATSGVLLYSVYADPTVNLTAAPSSADVGQHATFSASVGGGSGLPVYAWSGLPAGCPLGPATGSVTCTVTSPATSTVDVTVTDANGFSVTAKSVSFTVYADPALATPTASVGSADVGQPVTFSDTPTSVGAGSLVWSWSSLPGGCSGSAASLTCNPTGAGSFAIQVSVTDANGFPVTSASLDFTVFADPTVSLVPTVASADVGQAVVFSATTAGGSGGLSFTWSGLPAGCPATPSTASVSCASVTTAATTLVSVAISDSNHDTATSNVVTFTVYADPTVDVTATPSSADIGQSVTFTAAAASGTGTYTYSWTGLPAGCPSSPATMQVTCTTSAQGTTTVSASVTDSNLKSATSSGLAFTVFMDPSVSAAASRASADAGQVVTFTATATSGSGSFTYAWSGLPSGCSGTTASVACVAPTTVTTSASFLVSVKVVDSNGVSASSATVTLTVFADPTIGASSSRASADDGQTVVFSAVSTLGSGSDAFSWAGLPATGCSAASAATVTCTIAAGVTASFSASATVSDSDGFSVTSSAVGLSTFVDPTITTPVGSVGSADVGQGVTFSVTTTPGSGGGSVAWANLPTGCTSSTASTATCVSLTTAATTLVSATYTDSNGFAVTSAPVSFTVFADPVPTTPTASVSSADIGQPVTFSSTISAGGSGGTLWSWSGLPTGCPAGATGASVVCPSVSSAGSYSVQATATDSNGGSAQTQSLAFVVYGDPSVSVSATPRAADVGQSATFTAVASGGTGSGYTYAWSGLPSGCPAFPTTATVSCASLTIAETTPVSVTASDSNGEPATSNTVSYTISTDPTVSASESRASADTGQAVTFTAVGTPGAGTLLYTWQGLPTGCSGASAIITCIAPNAGSGSTSFTVTVRVLDGNGMAVTSSSLTLTVFADPTISDAASRSTADIGQSVTFTATSTLGSGGNAFAWSGLPAGCPSAPTTASVTCVVTAAASTSVSATVTDSNGYSVLGGVVSETISVDPTIATPTASVTSADVSQGVTFSAATTAGAGGDTVAWSGLPSGCGASTNNYVACTSLTRAGTATVSATITDANGFAVTSGTLSFTVYALPIPTTPTASVGSADVGQAVTFSSAISSGGSGGILWSWSGLPNGCPANPTTATVSCSSVTVAGTFSITASATDSNGGSGRTTAVAFVVYPDPTIASPTANRTSADVGQYVEFFAAASGGSGGYSFSWTALPGGCVGTGASLKCQPGTSGTTDVIVKVTDSNGVSASSGALPFTVYADPTVSAPSASVASADVGQTVSFTVNAQDGSAGYTYRWTNLPSGCAVPSTEAAPTCTVSTAGTFSVQATVTDSNGASVTSSALSYTVYADPTVSPPVASASSADTGQSVTFTVTATLGSGGYSYAWLGLPAGCTGTATATASCSVSQPIVVSAEATDSNGVTATSPSLAYTVFVDPSASAPVANRSSADDGQSVTFSTQPSGGSGGYQYSWQGVPAACAPNSASISCVVASTIAVSVIVTDSNGVKATSGTLGFTVYPVPTVSSPLANRTSFDAGQNVTFNATVLKAGAGATTFFWASNSPAFVCGVSGTLAVSCRAATAGSYNVTLTVTDRNDGSSSARSLNIVAVADPTAAAPVIAPYHTFDATTTVSGTIAASGGAGRFNYTWQDLPDGCSGSGPTLTCTPASSGTFNVQVWIVDGNGFGFHSPATTLVVNKALSSAATPNRQTSTVGIAVILNANATGGTAPFSYAWDFGDGARQTGPVASHEYSNAGTYTVTLWINDSGGGHAVEYWVVSVSPAPTVLDLPAVNVAQLELIAAFIILALLVAAVLIMAMRRSRKMREESAPPVQAWQGKPPAPPAAPAPAAKTNIDQTLAELEAISEDGGPSEP
jgi:hypothetical protein